MGSSPTMENSCDPNRVEPGQSEITQCSIEHEIINTLYQDEQLTWLSDKSIVLNLVDSDAPPFKQHLYLFNGLLGLIYLVVCGISIYLQATAAIPKLPTRISQELRITLVLRKPNNQKAEVDASKEKIVKPNIPQQNKESRSATKSRKNVAAIVKKNAKSHELKQKNIEDRKIKRMPLLSDQVGEVVRSVGAHKKLETENKANSVFNPQLREKLNSPMTTKLNTRSIAPENRYVSITGEVYIYLESGCVRIFNDVAIGEIWIPTSCPPRTTFNSQFGQQSSKK